MTYGGPNFGPRMPPPISQTGPEYYKPEPKPPGLVLTKQIAFIQRAYIAGSLPATQAAMRLREGEHLAGARVHSIAFHTRQMQMAKAATSTGGKLPVEMSPTETGTYGDIRRAGGDIPEASRLASTVGEGERVVFRGAAATLAVTPEGTTKPTKEDIAGTAYGRGRVGSFVVLPVIEVRGKLTYDVEKIEADPELRKIFAKEDKGAVETLAAQYRAREQREAEIARGAIEVTIKGKTMLISASDANKIKEDTPELYKILKDKGWAAYEKAAGELRVEVTAEAFVEQQEIRRNYTPVPGGGFIRNSDLADMRRDNPEQAKLLMAKGWTAYNKARAGALADLTKYGIYPSDVLPEGAYPTGYNVIDAIKEGKGEAVQFLFGGKVLQETKDWLREHREVVEAREAPVAAFAPFPFDPGRSVFQTWMRLKDKPKTDSERVAFLKYWQLETKEAMDIFTSSFVFGGAPAVWKGIGAIGTKLTPAFIAKLPVVNIVPRIATALAQIAGTGAPLVVTGATISESMQEVNLQRKWEIFSNLPLPEQNKYAEIAGFPKYEGLSDPQKALVLLYYTVPFDYSSRAWSKELSKHTGQMIEVIGRGAQSLREATPAPLVVPSNLVIFAGGCAMGILEGVSYTAQLPLIAANLMDTIPKGTSKEFATELAMGMAAFFITVLPAAIKADPTLAAGRIAGLFILSPATLAKLTKGGFARLREGAIPERAMANEIPTLTFELVKGLRSSLTKKQLMELGNKLVTQLKAGKDARVRVGSTIWQITVRNVPYQKIVGNVGWHFTPDIRTFNPARGTGTLYLAPQAAVRAGIRSLVRGQPMKHPGLVEVHLPPGYKVRIGKTLGKGKVELEIPLRQQVLDPIPGRGGRGISANAYMGSYPVRRFVIKGSGVQWKGLTAKQYNDIVLLTAKEAGLDLILGWHGRMQALKTKVQGNPKVKKINESITQLKSEQPELVGPNGQILRQRQPVPHPTKPGNMNSRVTGVVRNSKGEILLTMDKVEHAFSLPGGRIDLNWWRQRPKGGHTWESALNNQLYSELYIQGKGHNYLGLYRGKVNEYALSGSRVFEALATKDKLDPVQATRITQPKGAKPEIQEALWWDGKTDITVYPAIYDILSSVAKKYNLDMSKVHIYKEAPAALFKARDTGFAGRVAAGRAISEVSIKKMNQVEINSLIKQRNQLIKGEPMSLKDWFTTEQDMHTLAEILHGRRRAVNIIADGKVTPKEATMLLKKHWEVLSLETRRLLAKRSRGETLTAKEIETLEREMSNTFRDQRTTLKKSLDRAEELAYYENRPYFEGRYGAYLARGVAKATGAAYRPIPDMTREAITKAYIASMREAYPQRYEAIKDIVKIPERPVYERIKPGWKHRPGVLGPRYGRAIPPRPEPTKPTPVRPEPVRPEPVKPEPVRPKEPIKEPKEPPIILPPRPPISDKKKRKLIRKAKSAFCFRMGQLGKETKDKAVKYVRYFGVGPLKDAPLPAALDLTGLKKGEARDVWYVYISPYNKPEHKIIVVGKAPKGALIVKGPKTAKKSIQMLYGRAIKEKRTDDIGIMDAIFEPMLRRKGIKLSFKPDPKQETTGDFGTTFKLKQRGGRLG